MALMGSWGSDLARRCTCQWPLALSSMSSCPWMRVSTFQAVSPWRTAMMRVACMVWGPIETIEPEGLNAIDIKAADAYSIRASTRFVINSAMRTEHPDTRELGNGKALLVKHPVALGIGHARDLEALEVIARGVHQVRGHDVLQRGEHGLGAPGVLLFPVTQHLADELALQILLAAAQGTGNDRELLVRRPARQVFFRDVGQRTDHDVTAVVAHQLGRHALELAAKEHVQEEGLQHVVAVMAERDLGDLELVGHPVQDAAAQARTQAAHGLALGNDLLDDAVGVLRLDVKLEAELGQVLGQDVRRKAGLLLV